MILLDPDLDPAPTHKTTLAKRAGVSVLKAHSKQISREVRLPSARTLARFLAEAQKAVRLRGQVTVLLTTDASIRRLNKQFRGKNRATDVLSFPASGPGAEELAGDLAISVTTALGQATEQGHSLSTEIKVLVLHGLLHLAGYDHEVDDGEMARRERVLRAKLKLPQGLIERAGVETRPSPKERALKGHGFSRAAQGRKRAPALAAEGMPVAKKTSPRGLKPRPFKASSKPNAPTKAKRAAGAKRP